MFFCVTISNGPGFAGFAVPHCLVGTQLAGGPSGPASVAGSIDALADGRDGGSLLGSAATLAEGIELNAVDVAGRGVLLAEGGGWALEDATLGGVWEDSAGEATALGVDAMVDTTVAVTAG
jgi:hypothetical protein